MNIITWGEFIHKLLENNFVCKCDNKIYSSYYNKESKLYFGDYYLLFINLFIVMYKGKIIKVSFFNLLSSDKNFYPNLYKKSTLLFSKIDNTMVYDKCLKRKNIVKKLLKENV